MREIRRALAHEGGTSLSPVRIVDICLRFSHPTAGVPGVEREVRVTLRG